MGTVYEAVDQRVGATVALKEAFPESEVYKAAFKREARLLANLSHEAFPKVMDLFVENGGHYLVMEFVEGKDLDDLLRERGRPFGVEEVLDWADQMLDALEYLHGCGVVHRDIKPQNLKCSPRGKIKILDFGIAKGAIEDITTVQQGSLPAATLYYAPLEQSLRADADTFRILEVTFQKETMENFHKGTDARSDLYALGATLYHLLVNQRPIKAYIRASSVWHGKGDVLRPVQELNRSVSDETAALLKRAMEVERENRYQSASGMREALRRARRINTKSEWASGAAPPARKTPPQTAAAADGSVIQKGGQNARLEKSGPHTGEAAIGLKGQKENRIFESQSRTIETEERRKRSLTFAALGAVVSLILGLGVFSGLSQSSSVSAKNPVRNPAPNISIANTTAVNPNNTNTKKTINKKPRRRK